MAQEDSQTGVEPAAEQQLQEREPKQEKTAGTTTSDDSLVVHESKSPNQALLLLLKTLLGTYHTSLVERPLMTKSLTSACIAALGTILAGLRTGQRSLRRTLSFFVFGAVITGPVYHWWYGFLERRVKLTGRKNVMAKVALDRLLLTPPFLGLTLWALKFMETGAPRLSWDTAKRGYPSALVVNYKVWTVAQFVNFTYVPPAYRVLFGNVVALWWSFYLSLKSSA